MSVQNEVFTQAVRANAEAGNRLFKLFSEAASQSIDAAQQFAEGFGAVAGYKAPAAVTALPLNVANIISELHASNMTAFERMLSAQGDAVVAGARGAMGAPTDVAEAVAESMRNAFKTGQDTFASAAKTVGQSVETLLVKQTRGRRAAA